MNIIKLAVKRRVTVMMLFVCIVMLGLVSFSRLGMDLMPDMEIPVAMAVVTANVRYVGTNLAPAIKTMLPKTSSSKLKPTTTGASLTSNGSTSLTIR